MDLVDFDRGVFDGIGDDFEELLRGRQLPSDSDQRAARRQRHHAERPHAVVRRTEPARVPRDRRGRSQRVGQAVPLPGAARAPARPTSSAATPARSRPAPSASATRSRSWPSGRTSTRQAHRHLGRRPRDGARADVGDADARRRDRHQPRRHARRRIEPPHSAKPFVESRFEAEIVWMDERPLDPARVYLLKQATRAVTAEVNHGLVLNQIGTVTVTTARPLVFDRYADNRVTGSFILIDPATNFTAGAGMITRRGPRQQRRDAGAAERGRAPGAARARRGHRRRRHRSRPARARGDPEMSQVADLTAQAVDLIAEQLADATQPAITSSFQAECVVLTDLLRQVRPDIPVLFLDTFHHFAQTLAYRDEMAARYELNLVNLRAAEPKVGLWQTESTDACCARHKVGPLFSALEALRRLVHGAAPRSVAEPGEPPGSRAVPAAERQRHPEGRPLAALDRARRVAVRQGPRHPAAARSTSSATRASAASRARRCRSIRTIRARAAGRARSSSAGFTSSRRRRRSRTRPR